MRKYKKPYRIRKQKSIFQNRFFWLSISGLIIVAGIFYLICFSPFFQIKEIKVAGSSQMEIKDFQRDKQKIPTEDIQSFVKQQLEKKMLFFKTKSIFLVNLSAMQKTLLENFPQIMEANLKRNFPDTLRITIEERVPLGVWCENNNCFFIDEEGIIFEKTQLTSGLIIKTAESKQELPLGSRVLEKENLKLVLEIQKKLREELKIKIEEFLIVSSARLEAKTSEGWWIYFNPEKDINWQIVELSLILEKQIPQEKRGELQYIDLRFDKIFVFPEEVLEF